MSDTVIKIENLSKQYRLGTIGTGTLSHDLNRWWARINGKDDPFLKVGEINNRTVTSSTQYVWALKDINLDVKQGEVLGVIGRNGAGKSTLLKILSRVTGPTNGSIKVKGRIGSLLEVGTGFHPELTGRENIFLNGAILGMTKWEIRSKLDEIVEFSGTARYIDTPVKRYSSGMIVRLAFAVAAHLDPEILIVDEVLAVGDYDFQKRAIGKMQDVSKGEGRTIVFVSHNMASIEQICENVAIIEHGKILYLGDAISGIDKYLDHSVMNPIYEAEESLGTTYIKKVEVKTVIGRGTILTKSAIDIHFELFSQVKLINPALSFQIVNSRNVPVLHILNLNKEIPFCYSPGITKLKCRIPFLRLYPDRYHLKVNFNMGKELGSVTPLDRICSFEVVNNEQRDLYWYKGAATYIEDAEWTVESN